MRILSALMAVGVCVSASAAVAGTVGKCGLETKCTTYTGVGLGTYRSDDERPANVKQLMAIRAAKVDAIRALAEQINDLQVNSATDLQSQEMVADKASIEMRAILKGIRFIKVEPIQQGIYQAVVEIDLID